MVAARISVEDGGGAAWSGGGGSLGATGTQEGVVGSSFATDIASAELAPILRDLCRLRWPSARPFDRRNLRVVPPTLRVRGPSFRVRAVRRDHRCRRLDAATRQRRSDPHRGG